MTLLNHRKLLEHMNPFGGETGSRLGPEGGQFSLYLEKGLL